MSGLSLYTYFRSSAVYRVRIALRYKGVSYESKIIHLLKDGGQEKTQEYGALNPQKLIPTLVDDGHIMTQSLAIIEYLDEKYPHPPLLPKDLKKRVAVRSMALSIACDIHPLNNIRVSDYLKNTFQADENTRQQWMLHWIKEGFTAIEIQLRKMNSTHYCFGHRVSLADLCLIPQVYNAKRFSCSMENYPRIEQIYQHCMQQSEFLSASPEQQNDYDL